MNSLIVIVILLCVVSVPNPTVGLQKWPKPSDLANHNGNMGESKVGWACSSSSDPNTPPSPPGSFPTIPGFPQIPGIPNIPLPTIPGLPHIPGLPGPFGPFGESLLVSQSRELDKCLAKDGSKVNQKCFSQIFSSWAQNDFSLDKECCEIIVYMDQKCNEHLQIMFKSHFFAPLLQYSCHIKHFNKN